MCSGTDALRLATSIGGKSWSDTTTVVMDDLASCNYREERERDRERKERGNLKYTHDLSETGCQNVRCISVDI